MMFLRRWGPALAKVKLSTGDTPTCGPALTNAREALMEAYSKTLTDIEAFPEDYHYRASVDAYVRPRLEVVKEEHDWEVIESRINAGQMEFLLQEARWQHHIIRCILEAKPWAQERYPNLVWVFRPQPARPDGKRLNAYEGLSNTPHPSLQKPPPPPPPPPQPAWFSAKMLD